MTFSRIGDGVLHWSFAGPANAPAVVLANSLGSDLRIWDAVVAHLPEYRVLRYDKRGHGLSDTAAGAFGIDDHATDLAALLDLAGIGQCAVIGLSVGGMIAQRLAVRFSERIAALVLVATAARIGTTESWAARIAAVEQGGLASVADAVVERWVTADFRTHRADEFAGWRNMLVRTPAAGYLATCAALRDTDLTADAPAIRAKTLCVAGEADASTPPDLVRATAALIPGGGFEVIAHAAHLPCLEQPEQLAALIRQHLAEAGHA